MSTAKAKQKYNLAMIDARCLYEVLSPYTTAWEIAGSLRRGKDWVGDVDHVIIPKRGAGGANLFGQADDDVNLLWQALDGLVGKYVKGATLERAAREDGRSCWGDRQRAITYNGYTHELYTATPDTIGIHLLIRTGPADFSRTMVTRLAQVGHPVKDGAVMDGHGPDAKPILTPTETSVFKLAGMRWIEPKHRR